MLKMMHSEIKLAKYKCHDIELYILMRKEEKMNVSHTYIAILQGGAGIVALSCHIMICHPKDGSGFEFLVECQKNLVYNCVLPKLIKHLALMKDPFLFSVSSLLSKRFCQADFLRIAKKS